MQNYCRVLRSSLQNNPNILNPENLEPLLCSNCQTRIGEPMRHSDERLAFHMIQDSFTYEVQENRND